MERAGICFAAHRLKDDLMQSWNDMMKPTLAVTIILLAGCCLHAQEDTTRKKEGLDSFLIKQKGIIGQLASNLFKDTTEVETIKELQRNDAPFQRYRGRIIRNIYVGTLDFGVSIRDTSQKMTNSLTRLGNAIHRKSRVYTIRNNLFFKEGQKVSPYVLGDNERHLRDLPYLQDARITVRPIRGTDSVDVVVYTKDVLSIGGSFRMNDMNSGELALKEENFLGWGDRIQVSTLYDYKRNQRFGNGAEYIKRNIGGSFIDMYAGYLTFAKAFSSGNREENQSYFILLRPLVNPYMKWTYSAEASVHHTQNMYSTDSLYDSDLKYKYTVVDAWAGWNMSADGIVRKNEDDRMRRLLALRVLDRNFSDKPLKYAELYDYRYADISAVLASASIFKQNFYKTRYIYGFGRNEDVPEGIDVSLTAGWTKKNLRERPYFGLDFERYYFASERYFNYTVRAGTFLYKGHTEDVDLLANLDYFSRLKKLGDKWKQRTFISAGISKQYHTLLNEPLMFESDFGLPGFRYNNMGGDVRLSWKAESVFFSPWSILLFKFAPFVFADGTYFRFYSTDYGQHLYSALGGGVRIRNESLIFGTIEIRGSYFPRKNLYGDNYRIDINTNIRFKYNQQLVKKPDFVRVN
jgi:hypothetical protein